MSRNAARNIMRNIDRNVDRNVDHKPVSNTRTVHGRLLLAMAPLVVGSSRGLRRRVDVWDLVYTTFTSIKFS